jgi:hypothetical protein
MRGMARDGRRRESAPDRNRRRSIENMIGYGFLAEYAR